MRFDLLVVLVFALLLSACTITGGAPAVDQVFDCSLGANIDFLSINGAVQACHKDNSIYFAVENNGFSALSGLLVQLEADYPLTMAVKQPVGAGESVQHSLSFGDQKMSNLRSMKITPLLGEEYMACFDDAIVTAVGPC